MCPRSVNTKLLQNSGVAGSVSDFPNSQAAATEKRANKPIVPTNDGTAHNPMVVGNYKIFVSTWNVGGVVPKDDIDLADWLDIENACDIYVLGFQETVPLSARNVLGPERTRPSTRWNSLIRAALNRSPSSCSKDHYGKAGEKQKVHPVKDGGGGNLREVRRDYRCVVSKQMVGILISVWVQRDLRRHIRHPSVCRVGCGIMGFLGNKGSVSVRFYLHGTSFCFVCCHLASGGKEGDELRRNFDIAEILSRTSFSRGPFFDLPRKIVDHDRVILLGDLNYRISLSDASTRSLVEKQEWRALLGRDQLKAEISQGGAFEGWSEGEIHFPPTYKYYPNSDEYYGCVPGKMGEKRRAPAWCDRILWYGTGLKQTRYDRCESRLSDHRPVRATFAAEVEESGVYL